MPAPVVVAAAAVPVAAVAVAAEPVVVEPVVGASKPPQRKLSPPVPASTVLGAD